MPYLLLLQRMSSSDELENNIRHDTEQENSGNESPRSTHSSGEQVLKSYSVNIEIEVNIFQYILMCQNFPKT